MFALTFENIYKAQVPSCMYSKGSVFNIEKAAAWV